MQDKSSEERSAQGKVLNSCDKKHYIKPGSAEEQKRKERINQQVASAMGRADDAYDDYSPTNNLPPARKD